MWVSHILQRLTWMLMTDRTTMQRVREARRAYASRRGSLVNALARQDIDSPSRSGFHVWIPVAQEASTIAALHAAGWAVAAGEPFRLQSPPGIRVTASRITPAEAETFAGDLATAMRARITTSSG
jgi:DNA-binding transcriptional MocR family regulator